MNHDDLGDSDSFDRQQMGKGRLRFGRVCYGRNSVSSKRTRKDDAAAEFLSSL